GLGVIFFATAATGGWPKFGISIQSTSWQFAVGIVGIGLICVSILFLFRSQTAPVSVNVKNIKIMYPDTKQPQQVKPPFEVRGECKDIPKNIELWSFHVAGIGSAARYWPDSAAAINGDVWRCRIGDLTGNPGEVKKLSIFAVGK